MSERTWRDFLAELNDAERKLLLEEILNNIIEHDISSGIDFIHGDLYWNETGETIIDEWEEEPEEKQLPPGSYAMKFWALDAWQLCTHLHKFGKIEVVRGKYGDYDGYLLAEEQTGSAYILGWIAGRKKADER